ncbi:MAG: tryptophan--tRNA ligase, partial [Rhodospirillales bacterium]|nr:tryptophan--tRNA ligase [Rhodospirillales bacterium]
ADRVPVGDDQRQHLELARDIAQKFNHDYGREFFPIIEPLIHGQATRVMSLRDGRAKMSKSDPSEQSRIGLTDDADTIARKIRRARTDPERLPDEAALADDGGLSPDLVDSRPEAANLLTIFAALARKPVADVVASYAGAEFSRFKSDLADLAVASLAPLAERTRSLLDERAELEAILDSGAERATAIAQPVVNEVKRIVGFF